MCVHLAIIIGAIALAGENDPARIAIESRLSAVDTLEVTCNITVDRKVDTKKHPHLPTKSQMTGTWIESGLKMKWDVEDLTTDRLTRWAFDGAKEYSLVIDRKNKIKHPNLRVTDRTSHFPPFTPALGTGRFIPQLPVTLAQVLKQESTLLNSNTGGDTKGLLEVVAHSMSMAHRGVDGARMLVRSRFDTDKGYALRWLRITADPDDPANVERFKKTPTDREWFAEMEVEDWAEVKVPSTSQGLMFPKQFVLRQSGGVDVTVENTSIRINESIDPKIFMISPSQGDLLIEQKAGRISTSVVGRVESIDTGIDKILRSQQQEQQGSRSYSIDARVPNANLAQRLPLAVAAGCFSTLAIRTYLRKRRSRAQAA